MELKTGTRWRSAVDSTEVVIVRAPRDEAVLRCGGVPMVPTGASSTASSGPAEGFDAGTLIGKRYRNDEFDLEVLCTKGGNGTLTIGNTALAVSGAKSLPSSD
jgi:hypothetical protein